MGDRGEDMQQMTTGRKRTRVTLVRTELILYTLYPVSHQGAPEPEYFNENKPTMKSSNRPKNFP